MNLTETRITAEKPKLAFIGIGWIGKNRMEAINKNNGVEILRIADIDQDSLENISKEYPGSICSPSFEDILNDKSIDAVVIATPSAMHAEQTIAALNSGKAVFCQKPLARDYEETKRVVDCARTNNKLLGVDFSYRHTKAFNTVYNIIQSGRLGNIFAVNLVFHNAYGPGKDWFYDKKFSGGGCLIDLGIHLIDLVLYALNFPAVTKMQSNLYSQGERLNDDSKVEDYVNAVFNLNGGITVTLNTSWKMNAGKDAVIEASFYGTDAGVSFKNINGSFYDFTAEFYKGQSTEILVTPPDDWMGRTAVEWVKELSNDGTYKNSAEEFLKTAEVIDLIYGRRTI